MGKKSAKIRKEKYGHNSEYYRKLAKKRWEKYEKSVNTNDNA